MEVIYLENNIQSFTTNDGRVCSPMPYNDGFILPLGWQTELQELNINFEIIDYTPIINEEI